MADKWKIGDKGSNFDQYNDHVSEAWYSIWLENAAKNYYASKKAKTLTKLIGSERGKPCVVVASGPSLDREIGKLKDFQGVILCSDSALSACLAHGVRPDYIVSIDSGKDGPGRFKGLPLKGLKLITNTSIDPGVLDIWKHNDVYMFNLNDAKHQYFHTDILSVYRRFPSVQNVGCVGGSCIALGILMGCRPVYLIGFDLGFTDEKYAHTKYRYHGGFINRLLGRSWTPIKVDHKLKIMAEDLGELHGVKCRQVDRFYREGILGYANQINTMGAWYYYWDDGKIMQQVVQASRQVPIINCTGGGILKELSRWSFPEVIDYYEKHPALLEGQK